jgi:hypothetical protein
MEGAVAGGGGELSTKSQQLAGDLPWVVVAFELKALDFLLQETTLQSPVSTFEVVAEGDVSPNSVLEAAVGASMPLHDVACVAVHPIR